MEVRDLLPTLVATITRNPRYQVQAGRDFKWEPYLWTHNAFRAYELLFGRRFGIRPGKAKLTDGRVACYSFEDLLAQLEATVRGFRLPKLQIVKVLVPQFAYAGARVKRLPPQYRYAIAVDNQASATGGAGTSSTVASFAITGSNTLLIGHGVAVNGTGITGATWNGGAMSTVFIQTDSGGSLEAQFALVGASGTHDLVISWGATAFGIAIATSYTGVNQSNTPDSKAQFTTLSAVPVTYSTTVVAANCWLILTNFSDNRATVAGTGTTLRQQGNNPTIAALDSNGTVSTGSQSLVATSSPANFTNMCGIISSWAPFAAAGPTNVKTWDGITQSSGIKTYFGVTLANVKTVNGIT